MPNYRIAYGRDTGSIEDPTQLVLVDLPDECSEMDTDALEDWLNKHKFEVRSQEMVGFNDVLESLRPILSVRLNGNMTNNIIAALCDAFIDNEN